MNANDKRIIRVFLDTAVPYIFLDSIDKILFDEFLKGKCDTLLKTASIDNDSVLRIISLNKNLYSHVDYSNNENAIYYNLLRLVISIMNKYKK